MRYASSRFCIATIIICSLLICHRGSSQSFEGILTLHVKSDSLVQTSRLTVKGDISLRETSLGDQEKVKVLRDAGAQTTTILRRLGDLRYGFRSDKLHGFSADYPYVHPSSLQIEMREAGSSVVRQYHCTKIFLKGPRAQAIAWITKDLDIDLATWFPEFLGSDRNPDLLNLRRVANQEGCIISYQETMDDLSSSVELNIEATAIPISTFLVDPDYTVLDEEKMKQLYRESRHDEAKKTQWEEFQKIFGKD